MIYTVYRYTDIPVFMNMRRPIRPYGVICSNIFKFLQLEYTFEPMRPLPEPSHTIPWTVPALVQAAAFAHQACNWVETFIYTVAGYKNNSEKNVDMCWSIYLCNMIPSPNNSVCQKGFTTQSFYMENKFSCPQEPKVMYIYTKLL